MPKFGAGYGELSGEVVWLAAHSRTGKLLPRNTPSLWSIGYAHALFVDGRAPRLEVQSLIPVTHADEMGRTPGTAIDDILDDRDYRDRFVRAFPKSPAINEANAAKALAAHQRTLVSGETPFDRWMQGDAEAISPAAARGFAVFAGPGNCASCHRGSQLTDDRFHDVGVPDSDRGRGAVTGKRSQDHQFRTPALREIGRIAPCMHDGLLATIEAVVDHYSDRVVERGQKTRRANLTSDQRRDLIALLHTLNSSDARRE